VLFFLLCDDVAVSGQPPEGGVALHMTPNTQHTLGYGFRCRPAAHANSGTDTVIENVRELCFHGTVQSTPRSRWNCWAVNDGVKDAQSGGMVYECE